MRTRKPGIAKKVKHTSSRWNKSGDRPSDRSFWMPACLPRRNWAIIYFLVLGVEEKRKKEVQAVGSCWRTPGPPTGPTMMDSSTIIVPTKYSYYQVYYSIYSLYCSPIADMLAVKRLRASNSIASSRLR